MIGRRDFLLGALTALVAERLACAETGKVARVGYLSVAVR